MRSQEQSDCIINCAIKIGHKYYYIRFNGWMTMAMKKIRVPIDVSMTAYQNARKYYQTKKQLKKVIKTKEAAESFLSNAEENIQKKWYEQRINWNLL